MLTIKSEFILIVLTICFHFLHQVNCDCPDKGNQSKIIPNIKSLINGKSSYRLRVEIINSDYVSIEIDEYYNLIEQSGWFNCYYSTAIKDANVVKVNYYQKTKEIFTITNENCVTQTLDHVTGQATINQWFKSENLTNLMINDYNQMLGPSLLFDFIESIENESKFIGSEMIDGHSTDHWFYCLDSTSGQFIEFWFDSKSFEPFRVSIYQSDELEPLIVYNFIEFEPLIDLEAFVYPVGFGCQPNGQSMDKTFPWNKNIDSFSLQMEAVISFGSSDKTELTSIKITKYQETFSFEINDESKISKIIQNGQHFGRYLINQTTGQCTIDEIDPIEIDPTLNHNHITTWPYHNKVEFNLLTKIILESEIKVNYMGEIINSNGQTMDIYEQSIRNFFLYDSPTTIDAIANYYFPVQSINQQQQSIPSKIIIRPINVDKIVSHQPIPSLIEMTTINHSEDLNEDPIDGQFDVSNCYSETGRYTWFQLILSDLDDIPISSVSTIRRAISKLLESFIPKIRLPEILVTIDGTEVYVTCKLLERPSIRFNYLGQDSYTISNPSVVIGQDNLDDCGQLCTDDVNCLEFSYCKDTRCLIFSPSSPSLSELSSNLNCSLFRKRIFNQNDLYNQDNKRFDWSSNQLSSSRTILHQLKRKCDDGLIVIPELNLSADDLFIVNGPEDVGSLATKYNDLESDLKKVNNYNLIGKNRRLSTGLTTINDISYQECLLLCENDVNCYSLSFCSSTLSECILSSSTSKLITNSLKQLTSFADNCNLFEKSYLSFYNKFPGTSLVIDSLETIENIDSVNCADRCLQLDSNCQSFDYCDNKNQQESSDKSICVLHSYHVSINQLINGNIWDFSKSKCDHYAKRLSRDYQHLPGVKFDDKNDLIQVINEITDVSMERCASNCNRSPNDCKSFEFCENFGPNDQHDYLTTCRLSTYKPSSTINNQGIESSVNQCSVYVKQRLTDNRNQLIVDNYSMAITLNAFFFIGAFVCGVIASIYYTKKR